ncbi:hypothetical protein BSKO_11585 [Bryopsis sp. KO-2023]|nr:hypothetical protein BSKO_11585 [Bryopsis sp. KO-2023]
MDDKNKDSEQDEADGFTSAIPLRRISQTNEFIATKSFKYSKKQARNLQQAQSQPQSSFARVSEESETAIGGLRGLAENQDVQEGSGAPSTDNRGRARGSSGIVVATDPKSSCSHEHDQEDELTLTPPSVMSGKRTEFVPQRLGDKGESSLESEVDVQLGGELSIQANTRLTIEEVITHESLVEAMVKSECGQIGDKLRFAFDIYDIDGSGDICAEDLRMSLQACLEENNLKMDPEMLETVVASTLREAANPATGRMSFKDFEASDLQKPCSTPVILAFKYQEEARPLFKRKMIA